MREKLSSRMKRTWRMLKQPSAKYSLLSVLAAGFFSGIIFWGGFNTGMEATNTMAFCISCHEMHDTVYQEYKETIHYSNRTGVRAICSDCHVPKDWTHKLLRKVEATGELWGKITGYIDSPAKFEARRLEMAVREWDRMKSRDSIECRNCHSFDGMDGKKQQARAQLQHSKAKQEGKTCIDCHKGIAHLLPREYKGDEE